MEHGFVFWNPGELISVTNQNQEGAGLMVATLSTVPQEKLKAYHDQYWKWMQFLTIVLANLSDVNRDLTLMTKECGRARCFCNLATKKHSGRALNTRLSVLPVQKTCLTDTVLKEKAMRDELHAQKSLQKHWAGWASLHEITSVWQALSMETCTSPSLASSLRSQIGFGEWRIRRMSPLLTKPFLLTIQKLTWFEKEFPKWWVNYQATDFIFNI